MDFERVGTVVSRYYLQPKAEPGKHHFEDWVGLLEEPMKSAFSEKGFGKCRSVLRFRRFVAKPNDKKSQRFRTKTLTDSVTVIICPQ